MSEWKRGIPTIPGYYWVYWNEELFILKIEEGEIFNFGKEEPLDYTTGRITLHNVDDFFWLGPIEMPTVPVEIRRKVR